MQAPSTRVLPLATYTTHMNHRSTTTHSDPSPAPLQGGIPTPTVEEVLAAQLESDSIGIPR